MPGEKLVHVMNAIKNTDNNTSTDVVFGSVVSVSPLTIKVDNRFTITEEFLTLSKLCKPFSISLPAHTHSIAQHDTETADGHVHTINQRSTSGALTSITIWRGLQAGDIVTMLRTQGGQHYYVIERKE